MMRTGLLYALSVCAVVDSIEAGIIATSGMVQIWHDPPETVEVNQLERNLVAIVFEEQTKVLDVSIEVDISIPGFYETVYPMTPGVITEGAKLMSYYFHADPRGQVSPGVRRYIGSVTFAEPVAGILVKPRTMYPTDHIFGLPTVRYPREEDIRQGVLGPGDYIALSEDMRTVSFDLGVGLWSDDFRVLLHLEEPGEHHCHHMVIGEEEPWGHMCPAPGTAALCLIGSIGAGLCRAVKRKYRKSGSGRCSPLGDPGGSPGERREAE